MGYIVNEHDCATITILVSIKTLMNTLVTVRSGFALASTLVVAFILCALAQAFLPGLQFSHMWLQLFTAAPVNSGQAWVEGIFSSAIAGFALGWCFAHCYNWSAKIKLG